MKQVIVMRHDLGMRMGKAVAQGCHAMTLSMLTGCMDSDVNPLSDFLDRLNSWYNGSSMVKVCLRVDSEEELNQIEYSAKEAGLQVSSVTDAGRTEFHGVPTKTCIAIGPNDDAAIDAITGKLKLL